MTVEVVGPVNEDAAGKQVLVKKGNQHFVVSSAVVLGVPETLVFPADAEGNVTDWLEVAGGKYVSREEAIEDLASSPTNESETADGR